MLAELMNDRIVKPYRLMKHAAEPERLWNECQLHKTCRNIWQILIVQVLK